MLPLLLSVCQSICRPGTYTAPPNCRRVACPTTCSPRSLLAEGMVLLCKCHCVTLLSVCQSICRPGTYTAPPNCRRVACPTTCSPRSLLAEGMLLLCKCHYVTWLSYVCLYMSPGHSPTKLPTFSLSNKYLWTYIGVEVVGWTANREIRVLFLAYPHHMWAPWWQGG